MWGDTEHGASFDKLRTSGAWEKTDIKAGIDALTENSL
jgi:hypothetical protein